MPEFGRRFEGYGFYDVGIDRWIKEAMKIYDQYGPSSMVEYPVVTKVKSMPLFTPGAYSCYAGLAKAPSGLYLFHVYETDAWKNLVLQIGDVPTGGLVGGIPLEIPRKSSDEFQGKNFIQLDPKNAALGGFNFLVNPKTKDALYAAGQFNLSAS